MDVKLVEDGGALIVGHIDLSSEEVGEISCVTGLIDDAEDVFVFVALLSFKEFVGELFDGTQEILVVVDFFADDGEGIFGDRRRSDAKDSKRLIVFNGLRCHSLDTADGYLPEVSLFVDATEFEDACVRTDGLVTGDGGGIGECFGQGISHGQDDEVLFFAHGADHGVDLCGLSDGCDDKGCGKKDEIIGGEDGQAAQFRRKSHVIEAKKWICACRCHDFDGWCIFFFVVLRFHS